MSIASPGAEWGEGGHEVAHGPAGYEEPCLHPNPLGRKLLEPPGCRVALESVVADLGLVHGPPHFGRRLRYRVAPEVYTVHAATSHRGCLSLMQ